MAYSVDWVGKVITIPQSDLTLISGVNYSLDMADVHVEANRLQSAFDEGLWAPQVIEFYPTVTLSGIAKPPTVEFINSYTVEFGGSNYNVFLSGYDTNLLDVLTPGNGISVLANNSVGKIITGSGVTAQDKIDIIDELMTRVIENGETFAEAMRLIRAEAAGDIVKVGNVHSIKSADGGTTRITATADADGRNVTATDGT